jgi:zinc/manganese transport system substrate-binding protein
LRTDDAVYFEQCFQTFGSRLTAKERSWQEKMQPYRGYKVITYHRAWSTFLAYFGLVSAGKIEPLPGVPPNDRYTSDLIQAMKSTKVQVIMVEPCYELTTPGKIALQTGAGLLEIPSSVGGEKQAVVRFLLSFPNKLPESGGHFF